GGDAGRVAVPEADELERVVERAGRGSSLGTSGAFGELRLAPLVLLLGQVLELLGERDLDLFLGGGARRTGRVEQWPPRPLGVRAAGQRRARERLGAGAQRRAFAECQRERPLAVAERQPRARVGRVG